MKTLIQWLMILVIVAMIVFRHWIAQFMPTLPHMPGSYVLVFAFSLAFTWVEILGWGAVKPFNCVKCLSGWFALILAFMFHTAFWYLYLPVGLTIGGIYSAIKMRWL